ncbi:glycosyltransferase family 2 protein [Rufibacter psychrotolerans]|uniref:glycosyltransferase family 2 protein n=1 Tax=Rufibacter psychrotolerans TaxID=2812556 RepID=UPI00196876B6|nr:glycosyltransferase family 2 protein [Rufibacter sp. SYSU D00308]
MPLISVIVPCYFNEKNIPITVKELINNEVHFPSNVSFEYVFVDDGSKDDTFRELVNVKEVFPDKIKVVKLAGNVGSHNAVVAGMEFAVGECITIISADLQDPPELMAKMYAHWQQGFKLVVGSRNENQDPILKRYFSGVFHALMRKLAFKHLPKGGFDYVLFDKCIKDEVLKMKEKNSNVMYLLVWMGFEYVNIPYVRKKRTVGASRWTFLKNVKLLLDSVLSFSYFPIRVISVIGLVLGFLALLYTAFVIYAGIKGGGKDEEWSPLMVVLLFASSFQMIGLGIVGEYVWRTFDASRERPLYIIERAL